MSQRRQWPPSYRAPARAAVAAAHAFRCLTKLRLPLASRSPTRATEIQPGPRSLGLPPVRPAPQRAWAVFCLQLVLGCSLARTLWASVAKEQSSLP